MSQTISYRVLGMTCGHCQEAVSAGLGSVAGVSGVEVDLEAKLVTVTGERLDDKALRSAIGDAGFEVAPR